MRPWRPGRRTLLRAGGVLGLLSLGGGWLYGQVWRVTAPAPGRSCLDAEELALCDRIGEVFFPGPPECPLSAAQVELTSFVDRHLGGLYEDKIRLFKILFRAVDALPVVTHGHPFRSLPLEDRTQLLEGWAESRLLFRRAGYASLRFVFSLGYFEHPQVRQALGLSHGCELEGR